MKHFFCAAVALLLLVGCSQTESPTGNGCVQVYADSLVCQTRQFQEFPNILRARVVHFLVTRPLSRDKTGRLQKNLDTPTGNGSVVPLPEILDSEESGNTTGEPTENWLPLFDGETLTNWSIPVYGGDGEVSVQEGNIVIGRGEMMTGIRYEKEFPNIDYEIRYEARRTEGYDFFAACTFPVKKDFCTFINGGWGGGMTGLSSVNGYDASENETNSYFEYKDNTWYRFRIKVTEKQIQVWITPQDKEGKWEMEQSVVDLEMDDDKELSIRLEVNQYKPLGFCTWFSEGQLRNIEYRKIEK